MPPPPILAGRLVLTPELGGPDLRTRLQRCLGVEFRFLRQEGDEQTWIAQVLGLRLVLTLPGPDDSGPETELSYRTDDAIYPGSGSSVVSLDDHLVALLASSGIRATRRTR